MPNIIFAPISFSKHRYGGWGSGYQKYQADRHSIPGHNARIKSAKIEPIPGLRLKVYLANDNWYIDGDPDPRGYGLYRNWHSETDIDLPIKVEVLGNASISLCPDDSKDTYFSSGPGIGRYENREFPHILVPVRVTNTQQGESAEGIVRAQMGLSGKADWPNLTNAGVPVVMERFGVTHTYIYDLRKLYDFLFLLSGRADVTLGDVSSTDLWRHFLTVNAPDSLDDAPTKGIKSVFNKKAFKPSFEKLEAEEPLLWSYLLWLLDEKTREKTSNNKLIKAFLETTAADYEAMRDALRESMDTAAAVTKFANSDDSTNTKYHNEDKEAPQNRELCLHLPGAVETEQSRKAEYLWQYRKGLEGMADGLGMSPDKHPTLWQALLDEKIPLNSFHAPGKKEQMVNNEFDLWERALSRPGWHDPVCEIAQDVARRTTYDKPVTPYLAFLMWTLPRYLDRVAPRPNGGKWSCLPKFVESQWELERDTDDENETGTSNQRSALTPVADNETGIVTVPYVSMQVSGRMTTYCYSGKYHVAEQGAVDPLNEAGGVWTTDFEEKLNGRDDYGLMFYTLIGTDRNTGYPTFLIILERLVQRAKKAGISTRVHFHRVHPNRSKKGIPTPTNRLIKECYRYMAGNVKAEEIESQQGDLIFVRVDGPGHKTEDPKGITEFESHAFVPLNGGGPVKLVPSTAKHPTNRLGYLYSEGGFAVRHPEHEDIERLEAGWYEVRRTKSWEANPTAVWSYTVD